MAEYICEIEKEDMYFQQYGELKQKLVRCKECKHRPTGNGKRAVFPDDVCPCQCDDYWYSWNPPDDWFCPKGEQRDGAQE